MLKLSAPDLGEDEITAASGVLRSGNLVQGQECRAFEKELAAYLDIPEVVLVSSGTAALHLSLLALGIGPGDAVLVPDFTFAATANAVSLAGARPVFVDVDSHNYNISKGTLLDAIERHAGEEPLKAMMPVHEFGCPVDMDSVMAVAKQYGLAVIEDAACALGAEHGGQKTGTFGMAGCFSFHPRKTLTTGEGGAICTSDASFARDLRVLRNHGIEYSGGKTDFVQPGYNYRMTDIQAAIGRVQLQKFPAALELRRKLKEVYMQGLASAQGLRLPEDTPGHSWQTFMVVLEQGLDRTGAISWLRDHDFESNLGAQSIVSLKAYGNSFQSYMKGWNSINLYEEGLALPFCENYPATALDEVSQALCDYLERGQESS